MPLYDGVHDTYKKKGGYGSFIKAFLMMVRVFFNTNVDSGVILPILLCRVLNWTVHMVVNRYSKAYLSFFSYVHKYYIYQHLSTIFSFMSGLAILFGDFEPNHSLL